MTKTIAEKALANDFYGRFREIVADPLNLLIERDPLAGTVQNGNVILHNGNRVPAEGPYSYYEEFSKILIINRGVHEPLEEFTFQELLKKINHDLPMMIELGAYWGHYSMWLKKQFPSSTCIMVEPEKINLEAGKFNFQLNDFSGEFINELVSNDHFQIDSFIKDRRIKKLDILHSDIQGFEMEMLYGAKNSFKEKLIDYVFISTHSQELHQEVRNYLENFGYRIEVSSDVDFETTSYDGLIFASSPKKNAIFKNFFPLGRQEILNSSSEHFIDFLQSFKNTNPLSKFIKNFRKTFFRG